jgi:hypothetical protein
MDVNFNSIVGFPDTKMIGTGISSSTNSISQINIAVIVVFLIIMIGYYSFLSSLGSGASQSATVSAESSGGVGLIEILLWAIFVVLIMINGMTYIFNIDIVASVKDIFTAKPIIDIASSIGDIDTKVPEAKSKKQVFHIPDNKYTYDDAKAICKAYDARLATYKEMSESFDKGADWCGFGWSDGQMALYPTQFEKWQNLQKIPGHEHDCGRPGINGGYISNPKVKYGINCYGYKPKINDVEIQDMETKPMYPKTKKEIDFEKKVEKWKERLPDILISPFNHDNWSIL